MWSGDWLGRRAQLSPDAIALIDATNQMQPICYRAWDQAAYRTALLLRSLAVKPGDRVAILAQNSVAYLELWYACAKLGAILQTLNWRLTHHELAALIADAEPTVVAYGGEYAETIQACHTALGDARLLALDQHQRAWPTDTTLADRAQLPLQPLPDPQLNWDSPWVICYTGGTTGLPKGAILTHGNIIWNAHNTITGWGLAPSDCAILNAPMFHTGGLNVFTAALVQLGGMSIMCRGFEPDQVFDLIRDQPVTLFFGVPTMFLVLQQHPRWDEADFTSLKLVISGGAPCPLPIFERFWERGVDFKTGYGLTEAGPNTFWLPTADVRRKPGAVGFPLPYVNLQIMAQDGSACGPNEVGELLISGPHVCAGYWNRPAETAAAITDGWLHTGDLASYDDEGYYTIVGRLKDVIISGGENIYPAEVESVLAGHPQVGEVALLGMPDPKWGEVGCAVVVPCQPDQAFDTADLLAYARSRLASYKIPRWIELVTALPRTAAGKIDKLALRAMVTEKPIEASRRGD